MARKSEAVEKPAEVVRASAATTPRLKKRYREEIVPALNEEFQYANVMQIPGLTKDRGEHGRRRGCSRFEDPGWSDPRSDRHHRTEAAGDQGPQVHRSSSCAEGPGDRLPRHAARRHVTGVRRPAADHRAAADPRLPWVERQSVRWQWQLHLRSERAGHVPRDRSGQDRSPARYGHHLRHHRHQRSRGPSAAQHLGFPFKAVDDAKAQRGVKIQFEVEVGCQGRREEVRPRWPRLLCGSSRPASRVQGARLHPLPSVADGRGRFTVPSVCAASACELAHAGALPGVTKSSW